MNIIQERLDEVMQRKSLAHGKHEPDGVMCVMEAAAYIAGEPWSDKPECVCPSLIDFMVSWNDALPNDAERDRLLKPLLPLVLGTRSTRKRETRRRWMAFDWLVREHTAAWLDLTDAFKSHGEALRGLPEITAESIDLALPILAAAGDAARDAARAAAWDAAWAAAWAAARAAAGGAAGDAARAAAWVAAWVAAGAAAGDAAGDAAGAAAWAAARAAARAATRAAAWDAAWDGLAPTTARLQLSAQDLVRRMCVLED